MPFGSCSQGRGWGLKPTSNRRLEKQQQQQQHVGCLEVVWQNFPPLSLQMLLPAFFGSKEVSRDWRCIGCCVFQKDQSEYAPCRHVTIGYVNLPSERKMFVEVDADADNLQLFFFNDTWKMRWYCCKFYIVNCSNYSRTCDGTLGAIAWTLFRGDHHHLDQCHENATCLATVKPV